MSREALKVIIGKRLPSKLQKLYLESLKKKKKNGDQISAFTENGDLHKRSSYLKTKNNVFISLFL